MRAALVTSFDIPPSCREVAAPVARTPDEALVDVLAAGLHPRVRSQADGSHYTSTDRLPLIPGVDGVGRGADGALRYFVVPDGADGSMAEQAVVDLRASVVLSDGTDPVQVAAAMNPAMSAWVALRRRIDMRPGASVLVLGATGNAGGMAVQVAKYLGAERVVGAGRRPDRLAELRALGADAVVSIGADPIAATRRLSAEARDVDVVLDYLWGQPAADALAAIVTDRTDRGVPLTWVQIGAVAGPTAAIPSAALRAARLQIVGSGQGSVSTGDYLAELPELAAEITRGTFRVDARPVPLAEVEATWGAGGDDRIVIVPRG
jgi:NADPH:quinone reductase-like Zn-dependent oxidoreductase